MPMSVITVAGINPILNILGATQQLNYTQELSLLQINNSFIPIIGLPSQFNMEYRNNLFSGFRWTHLTTNTDTYGSLTLQNFVNASLTGNNLISFDSSGIGIYDVVNLNSNKITNLADGVNPTDAVNFGQLTNGIVGIVGALYMSGNAAGTMVLANTFTKVFGVTNSSFLNNFTMSSDNQLQYTGINPINTTVTTNISANVPIAGSTIGVSIYKNGNPLITGAAANYAFQLTLNTATSLSVSVYAQFVTGDYVEVFVSVDSATTVLITDMNLSVSI